MSLITYDFRYYNPSGEYLFSFTDYYKAQFWVSEKEVGSFYIDIPHTVSRKLLKYLEYDGIVEIYRNVGARKTLLFNKRWFLGLLRDKVDEKGIKSMRLRFLGCNNLVDRRIVYYEPETAYTTITDTPADNAIKKVARENFGSLATDPDRDWSNKITIASDMSLCSNISMNGFSYIKLMTVMKNMCDAAYKENEEYLTYDMSWQPESNKYLFRTYFGQLGVDRGVNSQTPFILTAVGADETLDFGGLSYASVEMNGIDRRTVVYCGGGVTEPVGEEEEGERTIVEVEDSDLINASPFGRWEDWEDARNSGSDLAQVTAVAQERLEKWKPYVLLNGHMSDAFTRFIGIDFDWGDIVAFKFKDHVYDVHIDKVQFNLEGDGSEEIVVFTRNMEESYY